MGEIKRVVASNEAEIKKRKSEIEAELATIQPILDSANHLIEIRSLAAPHEAISDVLAAVLTLLTLSWTSRRSFWATEAARKTFLTTTRVLSWEEGRRDAQGQASVLR